MTALHKKSLPAPLIAFLGWLSLFTLLPFAIILAISFMTRSSQGTLEHVFTLENYARCFQMIYVRVFMKTLALAAVATTVCMMVGFPVAYFLARCQGRMRTFGLILIFLPFWTNFILRVHGMISVLGNHGLLNQLLQYLGVIDQPLAILYTRQGVFLGLVYNYLPFLVVPIYSALEKLDGTLREAAFDLGANRVDTFLRVVFPNIREGVVIGGLFVFIPMLGEYVIPSILGGAKEVFLGNIMVDQFYVMQDWPFGSAIAGLLSVILLGFLWMQSRLSAHRKETGASDAKANVPWLTPEQAGH